MLEPSMNKLLKNVPNRYMMVNITAKIAREIAQDSEEHAIPLDDKPVTMALREIAEGIVKVVPQEDGR